MEGKQRQDETSGMGAEIWMKQKNSTEASVHAKWRTGSAINFVRCHRNYMPSDHVFNSQYKGAVFQE